MSELMARDIEDVEVFDCSPCCQSDRCRNMCLSLSLGQVLSLCLCGTSVSSQLLADQYTVHTPTTQSFANYFLLCFVYGTILACRPPESGVVSVFRDRGWKYLLVAFIDVEANYLIVRAFQYTNLTSIQLLVLCFTIPVVLLLSWLFLSIRYQISHIIGVGFVLLGTGCLVWGDILVGKGSTGGSNRLLGDLLCLCGATLYGVCNVGEELLVKTHSRIEYLGMIGLFGSVISGIQLAVLEREAIIKIKWSDYRIILLYLGFTVCMFLFYSLVSVVMQRTSATLFNLAIQTSQFYALLFGLFLFSYKFHVLYFVSFAVVIIGSILYSIWPPPTGPRRNFICCPDLPSSTQDSEYREIGGVTAEELEREGATLKYCPVHGTVVVAKKETDKNGPMDKIEEEAVALNQPVIDKSPRIAKR